MGFLRAYELCKKAEIPEPIFLADDLEFKVIFKFPYNTKSEIIVQSDTENLTTRQQNILEILSNKELYFERA